MVAGSRTGSARRQTGEFLPLTGAPAWPGVVARAFSSAGVWAIGVALYLLAAAALLLPWPFGRHPGWAYNWEGYTAWRWSTFWEAPSGPALAILAPTDGLMTDSGQGPLVGLPVSLGFALGGLSVEAMRAPVALLAACAAPLLWLFGRRVAGDGPALFAALLLAVSPAFVFYARTATLVGISLVPLLLTALALARVLEPTGDTRWRWRREGLLMAALLLGIYAYAPVRLLWPLAVVTPCCAALWNRRRWRVLIGTALLCALVVPLAVMALAWLTVLESPPIEVAARYFHARGEQLVAMGDDPAAAGQYVRDHDPATAPGWETARRLVAQNAVDLGRLLADRDTLPVPTDYWNERGRLWPWFLLPLAVVGGLATLSQGLRGGSGMLARLLPVLLLLGLALPLLLTSRVHVGRLLPALPFALLLTATGVWVSAGWLVTLARRVGAEGTVAARGVAPLLAGALLAPVMLGARADMATPIAPTRESMTASAIASWTEEARERGGAVLVEDPALGDDIERVHAATYRLDLDRDYRFVDMQAPDLVPADGRPTLAWRGALGALQSGEIERPCQRLWFVSPEIAETFFAAWRESGCAGAPDTVILP